MKSLGRVKDQQYSCDFSWKSLGNSRIAVQFPGLELYCDFSWKSLGEQQDSCTVSRFSLGTSRIAVKYLGRVLGQAGWL